jgi:hypothetical protein
MNSSDPLQTEESGIGNDIYYAAFAVSPNANHQGQRGPLFTVDRNAKPEPNAACVSRGGLLHYSEGSVFVLR